MSHPNPLAVLAIVVVPPEPGPPLLTIVGNPSTLNAQAVNVPVVTTGSGSGVVPPISLYVGSVPYSAFIFSANAVSVIGRLYICPLFKS